MTREEAIVYLERADTTVYKKIKTKTAEALEMAIKALEQQPSEPRTNLAETSQDCISIEPIQWYSQNKDGYLVKGAYSKDEAYVKLTDVYEKIRISEDCISREAVLLLQTEYAEKMGATTFWKLRDDIRKLPHVTPKCTDEEIDNAQAVEQAYVDKMVELTVEGMIRNWLDSFNTESATKCYEAIQELKKEVDE